MGLEDVSTHEGNASAAILPFHHLQQRKYLGYQGDSAALAVPQGMGDSVCYCPKCGKEMKRDWIPLGEFLLKFEPTLVPVWYCVHEVG